jgi:hypothetical protein
MGQGRQPQADASDRTTGARLGNGEREARALSQPTTLAVDPGLRLPGDGARTPRVDGSDGEPQADRERGTAYGRCRDLKAHHPRVVVAARAPQLLECLYLPVLKPR